MAEFAPLPPLVRCSDGRVLAFEPDAICHDLFAATRQLGQPDSFLARELTDGVLHFLARTDPKATPTDDEIAELVVKVVRELGQPILAKIYETRWKERDRLSPTLNTAIYPADVLSLQQDGLLRLSDQETPARLAGRVVGPHGSLHPNRLSIREAIESAAAIAGQFVAIDGSESVLAEDGEDVAHYVQELRCALTDTKLVGILNLNCAQPPAWAESPGAGPLFENILPKRHPSKRGLVADSLLRTLAADFPKNTLHPYIWWHLCETDFQPEGIRPLHHAFDVALRGMPIEFVFDQPRKPVLLGPGLNRNSPAVLTVVGVNLPLLAHQIGEGFASRTPFLKKLSSLVRYAKTAAHSRQDYLRQHGDPFLREGFLLDRACLMVIPIGLAEVVQAKLEIESAKIGTTVQLAGLVVAQIRAALSTDRHRSMFCFLDSMHQANEAICLTDAHLSPRQQVRYGAVLHHKAGGGRLDVILQPEARIDRDSLGELLHFAYRSEVARLRFVLEDRVGEPEWK